MEAFPVEQIFVWSNVTALAIWLSLAAFNNIHAFDESVRAVGRTMGMTSLTEDPPVPTRLRSRAVTSVSAHQVAVLGVLLLQVSASLLLWAGAGVRLLSDQASLAAEFATLGLACAALFVHLMLWSGLWFGYWIREAQLQLTHLVILLWVVAVFLLVRVLPS